MEKEFVPYEQALALKELRFDEPCISYYNKDGDFLYVDNFYDLEMNKNSYSKDEGWFTSPTYSQAFRWFREKYGLSGWVNESFNTNNRQGVVSIKSEKGLEYIQSAKTTKIFETYEEAELECLKKLIEICFNKKQIIMNEEKSENVDLNQQNLNFLKQVMNPYLSQEYGYTVYEKGFVEGYQESTKWSRDKMYSEEDMIAFSEWIVINYPNQKKFLTTNNKLGFYNTKELLNKWLEKFKKK
jgi:hypothetical protein